MDLTSDVSGSQAPGPALPTPWVIPPSGRSLSARLWKFCDALVTAPARPRRGVLGHGRILLGRRTRRFDRAAAALNLVDSIVPGTAAAWSKLALRRRKLPLRSSELSLLAFGTGGTVFRLGPPDSGLVLKVERISLGLRPHELAVLAKTRRESFADILRQYRRVSTIFPPVQFLVVQSPLFGVGAVGALQPYVEGPFRDLLREVPGDELDRLVERRPALRAQIVGFLERTIVAWERGGWIVDLGHQNLVLAGEGDEVRLVYLDVEVKETSELRGTVREAMYEGIVERMREILRALDGRGGSAGPTRGVTSRA